MAVDPGSAGGIAWTEPGKGVQAVKMPDTDEGVIALVSRLRDLSAAPLLVRIEKVGGYIKTRKAGEGEEEGGGQPGSAMFKFGEGAGFIRGAFLMTGATVEMVTPQVWQKMLMTRRGKGTKKEEWKRTLKGFAQRFFPGLRVTLNTADALLILKHCLNLEGAPVPAMAPVSPGKAEKGRGGNPGEVPGASTAGLVLAKCSGCLLNPDGSLMRQCSRCREKQRELIEGGPIEDMEGQRVMETAETLFVGAWGASVHVFRRDEKGGAQMIRRASLEDLRTLPRLKDLPKI